MPTELFERDAFLGELEHRFRQVEEGEGHTVFLLGEAGIGKTSLLNQFIQSRRGVASVYWGACDSLFTPRPLGPLFDIAEQIDGDFGELVQQEKDRARIFGSLIHKLTQAKMPVVMVFEDIHWADEATFDLIKFLARRISRIPCLFIVSYRDDEIHARHPLSTIFGELPVEHFSKMLLSRFSREVVEQLAAASSGLVTGDQLFQLTAGNPFYVKEILSRGDHHAIPERVKDSILAKFHTRTDRTKALWEFLSALSTPRIDPIMADHIEREFGDCMDECINAGIIISRPGYLSFNHELFRKTIEESLSSLKRKMLHKKILDILLQMPADHRDISRLVHHARYAEEQELVADLAPRAAREAAAVGAHREAAKLYSLAIDLASRKNHEIGELYERHAYECYLTYQLPAAIASQQQALAIWRDQGVIAKEGDALRFLSRLWWFAGDYHQAVAFARESIDVLENKMELPSRERALAYSNFSQLGMLSNDDEAALNWGQKAIALATTLNDYDVLSHALNNVGAAMLRNPQTTAEGEAYLQQSLAIGLEHGYHEHAARSYVNLCYNFMLVKVYPRALAIADTGIKYCEERDLDFLRYYLIGCKARILLETGDWKEAERLSTQLIPNAHHKLVTLVAQGNLARIAMRRGEFEQAATLLAEIKGIALDTREIQRIVPILIAELELAWLTGNEPHRQEVEELENTLFENKKDHSWYYTELVYWKHKCGWPDLPAAKLLPPYRHELEGYWRQAAAEWQVRQAPYEQALALLEGDEDHQRQGLRIFDDLGAMGAGQRFRAALKMMGAKNIPRGPRESTLNNPAQLTDRQIEIVKLLKQGLQNKEIADQLYISPKTVDHHISAILTKLNVTTRSKAVLEAQKLGVLS